MPTGLTGASSSFGGLGGASRNSRSAAGNSMSRMADTSKYQVGGGSSGDGIAGSLTPSRTGASSGMGGALGGALGGMNQKSYSGSIWPDWMQGMGGVGDGAQQSLGMINQLQWSSYLSALGGPQMAALQNAALGAYAGQNLSAAQIAANRGYLSSELGYGLKNSDLDLAGIGLDRQGNELNRQGIGIDTGYYNHSKDIANRQLGNTLGSLMYEGVKQTRQNNSSNVAKGSWFAPGREYENQNIYKETAAAGDKARLGHEKEIAGYDRSIAQLGLDEKRTRLADQNLDLAASKIGLKKEQLVSQFNKAMTDLGFDEQKSLLQLSQMLSSNNAAQTELAMQWMLQAMQMSGSGPPPGAVTTF